MRQWFEHRQAYAPRTWPVVIATATIVAVLVYTAAIPVWLGAIVGAVMGVLSAWAQWALWRRRHPVISIEEYIEVLRRNARNN